MNIINDRAKKLTKGSSTIFVCVNWTDENGRIITKISNLDGCEVDGQLRDILADANHSGYSVSLGGAHGSREFSIAEGDLALAAFNSRVSELVSDGYEVENLKRTTTGFGRFLDWGMTTESEVVNV